MNNNKQSSIEWLYNELFPKQLDGFSEDEWDKIDKAFEQAKAMHKVEILKSIECGYRVGILYVNGEQWEFESPEHYYNVIFNNK